MRKIKRPVFIISALIALCVSAAFAHQGATGIVKERMDAFKQSQTHLKAITISAQNGDFETIENLAAVLAAWGRVMPDYFPEGSATAPSEASPDIWTDFARFSQLAEEFTQASLMIEQAAQRSDSTAVMRAIQKTAESCKSCHSKFRLK